MADLNALIAQGYQAPAPIDPFAQYAKMQQLNTGANQNALAQYQLAQAQRQDIQANALNSAYANATDPNTGAIDYKKVTAALAGANAGSQIPAVLKNQFEAQKAQTDAQLKQQELIDSKLKQSRSLLDTINPADPNAPQKYLAWHQANHADPILGPMLAARGVTEDSARSNIDAAIAQGPQAFTNLLNQSKLGVEKFAELNKPHYVTENLGNASRVTAFPGLGGSGSVLSNTPTSMTPGEVASNKIAQGNLEVNRGRLGIERAGLGIRAIQADPYNISGVQNAFPIPGAAVGGAPSSTEKQPSGAPVVQNVQAAIKAGLTGEDLLTHLPVSLASQIRAIGEGRQPSPAARSLTTPAGRQLMDLVNQAYPNYDAKQYATMGTAEKAFTSGKKGDTTRSLNVAVDHLGTLQQVADALQNNDTRLFNQAGNFIALQTGNPAPTDFNAVKRIVADEVTKAVLGSGGALGDRKAVDDAISSANSPAQLASVISKYKNLMGGQLNGIEQQYTASTGKKDFRDRFLTPTTRAALGNTEPVVLQGTNGFKYLGKE
jgi:hypothetical protein